MTTSHTTPVLCNEGKSGSTLEICSITFVAQTHLFARVRHDPFFFPSSFSSSSFSSSASADLERRPALIVPPCELFSWSLAIARYLAHVAWPHIGLTIYHLAHIRFSFCSCIKNALLPSKYNPSGGTDLHIKRS